MPITEAELNEIEAAAKTADAYYLRSMITTLILVVRKLQAQLNSKPQRKSKKKQVEEAFRESDLTAQRSGGRPDVDYGPHDSLPRGEHVAREGFKARRNG